MSGIADLVSFITSDVDFAALANARLYPITLPQEPTLPAVTYLWVDHPHEYTHDGHRTNHPRIQFDCYAPTYLVAQQLVGVLETICDRWNSGFGAPAFAENMIDVPEPDLPPLGARFRKTLDVVIWGLH